MTNGDPPGQNSLGHNPHFPLSYNPVTPFLLHYVARLGSGPRLVGRSGSGVRVSVSFQKNRAGCCPMAAIRGWGWGEGVTI